MLHVELPSNEAATVCIADLLGRCGKLTKIVRGRFPGDLPRICITS